jgi:hypothetical protein
MVPMLTISFYFLGLAVFVLATLICISTGKRAGKRVEVELDALHAAAVCLPTGKRPTDELTTTAMYKELTLNEKIKISDVKTIWLQWYERCKKKAVEKQKFLYSWSRTLIIAAGLCLIGVLLEAEFDQPITVQTVLAGFRRPAPASSTYRGPQLPQPQKTATPAKQTLPRKS